MRWFALLLLSVTLARADGEQAGKFDYYVLALTWSPSWCAAQRHPAEADQCEPETESGWILHGLWPQYERGWPSFCRTEEPNPTRAETAAMADIMGSSGLAWYQWKKHGRCSGLSAEAYFEASRKAFDSIDKPEVFRKLSEPVRLPAAVVEEAFMQANPGWFPDMLTVTCKSGRIHEVRLCLTRDFEPRLCGEDVVIDCALRDALMPPVP